MKYIRVTLKYETIVSIKLIGPMTAVNESNVPNGNANQRHVTGQNQLIKICQTALRWPK